MSSGNVFWGLGGVVVGLAGGFFIGRGTAIPDREPNVLPEFGAESCAPPPKQSLAPGRLPSTESLTTASKKRDRNRASGSEESKRTKLEASTDLLNTDREISHFLNAVRYENFFDALRASRPLGPDAELDLLNGRFNGEVQVREDRPWEMFIEAYLQEDGDAVKGKVAIQLSKAGKIFSNLSGDGNVRAYRRAGDNSLGLIVEASQEHYFQMYYLPQMDAFVGNYYEQTSPGVLIPKGTVRLNRA